MPGPASSLWRRLSPGADTPRPAPQSRGGPMCVPARNRSGHPDEGGVVHPDLALVQRGAGATGRDVLSVTGVDAHVTGRPDQVAWLGLGLGDHLAGVALGIGGAGQVDTGLGEDVLGEARAVEPGRIRATTDVARAHVLASDVEDLVGVRGGLRDLGSAAGLAAGGVLHFAVGLAGGPAARA